MRDLFAGDATLRALLVCAADGLLLDYSSSASSSAMVKTARPRRRGRTEGWHRRDAVGKAGHFTENRYALTLRRARFRTPPAAAGLNRRHPQAPRCLRGAGVLLGEFVGATGQPIRHVVHLASVVRILVRLAPKPSPHRRKRGLNCRSPPTWTTPDPRARSSTAPASPETPISSPRGFSTAETLFCGLSPRVPAGPAAGRRCRPPAGISWRSATTWPRPLPFGIAEHHFPDARNGSADVFQWWSAIGLPLMLAFGTEGLRRLPRRRSQHGHRFASAPFSPDLPVITASSASAHASGSTRIGTALQPPPASLPAYRASWRWKAASRSDHQERSWLADGTDHLRRPRPSWASTLTASVFLPAPARGGVRDFRSLPICAAPIVTDRSHCSGNALAAVRRAPCCGRAGRKPHWAAHRGIDDAGGAIAPHHLGVRRQPAQHRCC